MKKRLIAFLLAVSIAVSMLAVPVSAAGNANTAALFRFCSTVRLHTPLGTAVRFYTRLLHCLTRLALRAFRFLSVGCVWPLG